MRASIVEHLKAKYQPNAIILHGSRARGKEREHSDWDFILLYNFPGKEVNGREMYENQNIEFSSHLFPVENIQKEFSAKLQVAQVVYEENGEGTDLLAKAAELYQRGIHWPEEKINSHKLWVQGRIDGMRDSVDKTLIFSKYYADLYPEAFNYWYWIVQNACSQPIYVAVAEIAEKDPIYFELVAQFADASVSPQEKVEVAEKIRDRLFQ